MTMTMSDIIIILRPVKFIEFIVIKSIITHIIMKSYNHLIPLFRNYIH